MKALARTNNKLQPDFTNIYHKSSECTSVIGVDSRDPKFALHGVDLKPGGTFVFVGPRLPGDGNVT